MRVKDEDTIAHVVEAVDVLAEAEAEERMAGKDDETLLYSAQSVASQAVFVLRSRLETFVKARGISLPKSVGAMSISELFQTTNMIQRVRR